MQLYTLCCYLLKSTFNASSREVDMDVAMDLIESTSRMLQKEELSTALLIIVFKTIGTLAVQASLNIRNSVEVFKTAN